MAFCEKGMFYNKDSGLGGGLRRGSKARLQTDADRQIIEILGKAPHDAGSEFHPVVMPGDEDASGKKEEIKKLVEEGAVPA